MAVHEAVPTMEQTEQPGKMAQWTGVIALAVYAVLGLVVVAVVVLFATHHVEESKVNELRGYWDDYYVALKDAKDPQQTIEALEGVWDKVAGTPVQPYVAMQLAQLHHDQAAASEASPANRKAALDKSQKLYDLALEKWGDHLVLGGLALEGAAMCREQSEDYDGAAELIAKNADVYKTHFRYYKLCYDGARYEWLRSMKAKAENKSPDEGLKNAREWLKKCFSDPGATAADTNPNSWRREAEYLRVMVSDPGPLLKDGKIPPQLPNAEIDALNAGNRDALVNPPKPDGAAKTDSEPKTDAPAKTEGEAKTEGAAKTEDATKLPAP